MPRRVSLLGRPIAAVLAGLVVASDPRNLLLVLFGAVALLALTRPLGRLLWFIGGAFLVLQVGDGLNAPKLAYLAGVVVSAGFASSRLRLVLVTPWGKHFKSAVVGAGILACLVMATALISLPQGVLITQWGRDAITFLLISAGVVVGLDCASSVTPRTARGIVAIVGVIGAISFSMTWLSRRGVSTFDFSQVILASMVVTTPAFVLGLVRGLEGRRWKLGWLALSCIVLIAVLVTGTRTGLVLAGSTLGIVGTSRKRRLPAGKSVVGVTFAGVLIWLALPFVASRVAIDGFGQSRVSAFSETLTQGISQDRSGEIRVRAYSFAHAVWDDHIFFGRGLGQVFPDPSPGGGASDFSIDTPMVYLAKFGMIGSLLFLVTMWNILKPCVTSVQGRWLQSSTVSRGTVAIMLCILPFGAPTEDKGFALAVALLILLTGSEARSLSAGDGIPLGQTAELRKAVRSISRGQISKDDPVASIPATHYIQPSMSPEVVGGSQPDSENPPS